VTLNTRPLNKATPMCRPLQNFLSLGSDLI